MKTKLLLVAALALILITSVPVTALAQVKGQCADCHTMHNSQGGAAMAKALDPSDLTSDQNSATPFARLLRRDGCLGCHAGAYDSTGDSLASCPKVYTNNPTYTGDQSTATAQATSAGGNFYWVKADDATGHNVVGIKGQDAAIGLVPPGFDPAYNSSTHGGVRGGTDAWATKQLTCAGTNGCHGTAAEGDQFLAISGAHHGVDTELDGSTNSKSYRFLLGIKGIEDDDWEYNVSDSAHNQYHGQDRSDAMVKDDTSTISYLCCECHGAFHAAGNDAVNVPSKASSPWLRHPTDFDMGNLVYDGSPKEYQYYNGNSNGYGTAATYSFVAPVASDLDTGTPTAGSVQGTVFDQADDAIVTCISCHRAHGSPYADLLRWRYTNSSGSTDGINAAGGAGNTGCFICHTTKDDNS